MEEVLQRVRVSFRIKEDLYERVRTMAYEMRMSQQEIIDKALESYFDIVREQ